MIFSLSLAKVRRAFGFMTMPAAVAAAAVAGVILLWPRAARADRDEDRQHAGLALGLDLEGAVPINIPQVNGNTLNGGGGFKLRIGEQLRYPAIRFTPEGGYGYDHLFASDDQGNSFDWDLHRVFVGARIGFGYLLVPVIYGHVGYGWRATGEPSVPQASGFAYDFGGALDLHLIPHIGVGVHVEYDGINSQPYTPQWLAIGAHMELVF